MDDTIMTIDDFEERAMAYGANLDAWPDGDRAAATALLARSAAAREALAEAEALDAMLDLWEGPQPSNALLSRVLGDAAMAAGATTRPATASEPPVRRGWLSRVFGDAPLLRPGLALAACLAFGFVMGVELEDRVTAPATTVEADARIDMIDFAFALEDDSDLLLGPETFL